ncbi:MAG: hypothetical protein MUC85_09915 [Anaerolineales bacterium]|nr:hypothetical protein [Anaerolineales bacterium]
MEEALRFFRAYEVWIYLLLALGGLIYVRKFILAWGELRGAGFGLERESAQSRLNQAAAVLVLLLTMAIAEFVLVSFVAPTVPGAIPILTPTLDLLATPTTTLAPATPQPGETPLPDTTPITPTQAVAAAGCIPGQIFIAYPQEGDEISGAVEISGTVDIPNFGFYKLEMKRPEETSWLTILAGNQLRRQEVLGIWNTSLLPPGYHQLGLVVTDNQGNSNPPCVTQVRVTNPEVTP